MLLFYVNISKERRGGKETEQEINIKALMRYQSLSQCSVSIEIADVISDRVKTRRQRCTPDRKVGRTQQLNFGVINVSCSLHYWIGIRMP